MEKIPHSTECISSWINQAIQLCICDDHDFDIIGKYGFKVHSK